MDSKLQISIVAVVLSLTVTVLLAAIPDKEALAELTKPNPRGGDLQLPPTQPVLVSMLTSAVEKLVDSGPASSGIYDISGLKDIPTRPDGEPDKPKPSEPKPSQPDGGPRDGG